MFSFLSESTPSTMDVSSFKGFLSYLCKLDVGGGGEKRVLYRNLILSKKFDSFKQREPHYIFEAVATIKTLKLILPFPVFYKHIYKSYIGMLQ